MTNRLGMLFLRAQGIDVLSPLSGKTLGTIHLGAGLGGVNLAFAPNGTTYVVGKGEINRSRKHIQDFWR